MPILESAKANKSISGNALRPANRRGNVVARVSAIVACLLLAIAPLDSVLAQSSTKGASGLPLPRFASLKAPRINMRVGPGTDYAVTWLYKKQGLPVEIVQEYDNWRRIRDVDGTEGWVYHSLLSGTRTAIAAPWMRDKGDDIYVNLRGEASENARILAKLQPGVYLTLDECTGDWCQASVDGTEGWVSQAEIWGAYPGEAFK